MDDKSLVEMIVIKVSPYLREDRPLLWLGEKDASRPRLLPIAIGEFEAAAIQMSLDGEDPIRPISYDLLSSMLEKLDIEVRQIVIHAVRNSIYYAKIAIKRGRYLKDIDSRPSDAIALALRTGTPIYISRELLDQAGLMPLEDEIDIEHTLDRFYEFEPQISEGKGAAEGTSSVLEVDQTINETSSIPKKPATAVNNLADELTLLQSKLERAVICEEYEEAARIRDEIESLVNKDKG